MHSYKKNYWTEDFRFFQQPENCKDHSEEDYKILNLREQQHFLENHAYSWESPLASAQINRTLNEQQDQYLQKFLCENSQISLSDIVVEKPDDSTNVTLTQLTENIEFKSPQFINSYSQIGNTLSDGLKSFNSPFSQCECPPQKLCVDYDKNLPGYIFKTAIRLMFCRNSKNKLGRVCQKWGVNPQHFRDHYTRLWQSISGPNSLISLFRNESPDDLDASMREMFDYIVGKILRGRYILCALKEGKMKSLSSYIAVKNKYLLYFSKLIPN